MNEFDKKEILITQRARMYMEKLSKGISPIDDSTIENDSVLNNSKVRNCFKYLIGVLETYEEALEGVAEPQKQVFTKKKKPFHLRFEERLMIPISDKKLKTGDFVKNINTLIDENVMRRLKISSVNKWLIKKGFLETVAGIDGKNHKCPTETGVEIGISKEKYMSKTGFPYLAVLLDRNAQQIVADNIEEIIEINNMKKK